MHIRPLSTIEEYSACEQLMIDCWQSDPIEAVPAHLLITIQGESGVVLGAFLPESERLVGFCFGFLARDGDGLKHHSHMAGVHPDFRDRNIAFKLKLAQRAWALGQGLPLMTWTFDPLEARNANLNIAKLGATARHYKRNIYGQRLGALNADLPTDRFVVRWELASERAQAAAAGQAIAAPKAEGSQILSAVSFVAGLPNLTSIRPLGTAGSVIGIQIPAQMQALKAQQASQALTWRLATRAFFEEAFAIGYAVVNVHRDHEHPYGLAVYTLQR